MKHLTVVLFGIIILFANPISKCIDGGGIYVPNKGCLIEGRAICPNFNPNLNDNTTIEYGWAKQIPHFAEGYVELGEYNDSSIQYTAKIDKSCRNMTDEEIKNIDTFKLLIKRKFPKKGTFIHYGNTPFEWAYIPKSGNFIGFLKPSEGGFLEYVIINTKEEGIEIEQNDKNVIIKVKGE